MNLDSQSSKLPCTLYWLSRLAADEQWQWQVEVIHAGSLASVTQDVKKATAAVRAQTERFLAVLVAEGWLAADVAIATPQVVARIIDARSHPTFDLPADLAEIVK